MKVKDCMCNNVCCVKPETNIYQVAKLMNEYHIGSIPVCNENQEICGIVTDRDIILRGIACDKNPKQTHVKEIMTCNVCSCDEEDEIVDAENKMAEYQIRRLPVCNCNNKVIGIITMGDLAQNNSKLNNQEVSNTIEKICCDCNTNIKNNN